MTQLYAVLGEDGSRGGVVIVTPNGVAKALAAPLIGAVAGAAWVAGMGPYGLLRPMPAACETREVCVIVAGLDHDVRYLPGGGDTLIDLSDDDTTRVVRWIQTAAAANPNVRVYKYPREIALGEPGMPGERARQQRAIRDAQDLAVRFGASLVVIGAVTSEQGVAIAFVTPGGEYRTLPLTEYAAPAAGVPEQFAYDLRAALAALPTRVSPEVALRVTPPPEPASEPPEETQIAALAPKSAAPPPPSPPPGPVVVSATLLEWPSVRRMQAAYPRMALRRGEEGEAVLRCRVSAYGRLDACVVVSEAPAGHGFGRAALELAPHTRATPQPADGRATDQGALEITYQFALGEEN